MASDIVLRAEHVYKKFRKGEKHDSLRELIPAFANKLLRRVASTPALEESEFWALRDVSFEVERGESIALIGANGAGKSTMFKHLSGLLKPTSGSIEVKGRLSALIEVSAGFHPDLTGRENVFLNGAILGMSRSEVRKKFDAIVEFSELAEFIDMPVKRYSSGMFARLGFSVAAHLEPDILLVDEILSVGDYLFRAKCVEKMKDILRGGTTVFFVSHDTQALADLCARSLLFERGSLVKDGPTSAVINEYTNRSGHQTVPGTEKGVSIEEIEVRVDGQPRFDLDPGDRIELDVLVRGLEGASCVTCWIGLTRDTRYVFEINSEVLGKAGVAIGPGETRRFRFKLDMHLLPGAYGLDVYLHGQDTNEQLAWAKSVVTLYVRGTRLMWTDTKGDAYLYPSLTVDDG